MAKSLDWYRYLYSHVVFRVDSQDVSYILGLSLSGVLCPGVRVDGAGRLPPGLHWTVGSRAPWPLPTLLSVSQSHCVGLHAAGRPMEPVELAIFLQREGWPIEGRVEIVLGIA